MEQGGSEGRGRSSPGTPARRHRGGPWRALSEVSDDVVEPTAGRFEAQQARPAGAPWSPRGKRLIAADTPTGPRLSLHRIQGPHRAPPSGRTSVRQKAQGSGEACAQPSVGCSRGSWSGRENWKGARGAGFAWKPSQRHGLAQRWPVSRPRQRRPWWRRPEWPQTHRGPVMGAPGRTSVQGDRFALALSGPQRKGLIILDFVNFSGYGPEKQTFGDFPTVRVCRVFAVGPDAHLLLHRNGPCGLHPLGLRPLSACVRRPGPVFSDEKPREATQV